MLICLFILYLVILFIEYKYVNIDLFDNEHHNILDDKINYNNENYDKLIIFFNKILKDRQQLLESGKMNYNEWIKYNNDNIVIEIDGKKYFIWIYEQLNSESQIISKANINKQFLDLSWHDIAKEESEYLSFTKYSTDPLIINNMFKSASLTNTNTISGYLIDENTNKPVKREEIFLKFYDKQEKKTGVIGLGIDILDISKTSSFKYVDNIHSLYVIIGSVLSLLISILIVILNNYDKHSYIKATWFIILINIFIFYFLNSKEQSSTVHIEIDKNKNVHTGMLSVSFLVGVNVYILTTLNKFKEGSKLFIESSIIFGFSIFLLLFSALQISTYSSIKELIVDRISTQFIFNYSIILNMFIILNFIIYFFRNKIKNKLNYL